MIKLFYDRVLAWGRHRHASFVLAGVAFAESSFFPLPPDILLIPMVLAHRRRVIFYALLCTLASVMGALVGYALGYSFFVRIGSPLLTFYGGADIEVQFRSFYTDWGHWIIFAAAFSFLPYKVATIISGAMAINLPVFIGVSFLGRAARFFLVGFVAYYMGSVATQFVRWRLSIWILGVTILLFGIFLFMRYGA